MNIINIKQLLCALLALCLSAWASADTYTYDKLNRLTTLSFSSGGGQTYTYDPAGNILSIATQAGANPIYALAVNMAGNGSGAVTGSGINCTSGTCSTTVASGTSVTLTASPASGSAFAGWSDACTGTGNCTVSVPATKSVTATFTLNAGTPVCTLSASHSNLSAGDLILTASCTPTATIYTWTGGACAGKTTSQCTVTPSATTSYAVAGINSVGTGIAVSATVTANQTGSTCTSTTVTTTSYVWRWGICAEGSGATVAVTPATTTNQSDGSGVRLVLGEQSFGTFSFPGNRANYSIVKTNSGFSVVDRVGSADTTAVNGAASIQFADVTVNLHIGDLSKTIAASDLKTLIELYVAFFNRIPDADGLAYWISQVKAGMTLDQIADAFYTAAVTHSDLTDYSSSMSHADFVRIIYQNVLGQSGISAPPAAEVQYWADQLGSGQTSRGQLIGIMLKVAHTYPGNGVWGWMPQLLDNKITVATLFAIEQGLNYNTPTESIIKGIAIAEAVTATSTAAAINLMNIADTGFNLTLP